MLRDLACCLSFGVAWALSVRLVYFAEASPGLTSRVCTVIILASCIDRGAAFLIEARKAWACRKDQFTAAGPWVVEIQEGGGN